MFHLFIVPDIKKITKKSLNDGRATLISTRTGQSDLGGITLAQKMEKIRQLYNYYLL